MKHLKLFENQSAYEAYLSGDDIWLPRVAYIKNLGESHTTDNIKDDNGPSYVDFSRLGGKFVEVANGGCMYFTDQVIDGVTYHAEIVDDELVISTYRMVDGEKVYTDDASIIDEEVIINW